MTSTIPQSRSSIDLGVSPAKNNFTPQEILQGKENSRAHPARLQHSPSLPNIWFPPHSGPIPPEMVANNLHRASTPPFTKSDAPVLSSEAVESRPRHVKYASIDPTPRKGHNPKTHTRRRTERDQPHALLTPPLTPSSSIRTSASHDSTASGVAKESRDAENQEGVSDPDTDATRFLLIGNVNRQISLEVLESAVISTLFPSATDGNEDKSAASTSESSSTPRRWDSPIRGVNQRCLQSKGLVPFVFFDIRHAKAAKDLIVVKSAGPLEKCVGEDIGEDGQRLWLTCCFVTAEDLSKMIGNSPFLTSSDGSFLIAAQKLGSAHQQNPSQQTGHESVDSKAADSQTTQAEINSEVLLNFLKSYGSIRTFILDRREVNEDNSVVTVYRVEYFDMREADVAYQDLKNQTLFGMKISAFGRKDLAPQEAPSSENVPFPNTSTAGESFTTLSIGPPGSQSLIRVPFVYPDPNDGIPAASSEHDGSKSYGPSSSSLRVLSAQGGAPSPPYFYTSSFEAMSIHSPRGFDYGSQGPSQGNQEFEASPTVVIPPSAANGSGDAIYRSDSISPCYNPDGVCLYCPSRASGNGSYGFAPYGLAAPSPTPTLYYPPSNAINPSSDNSRPYDYRDTHPGVVVAPWATDPAIAAISPGPTPHPYFVRDDRAGHSYYPLVQQVPHHTADPSAPDGSPKTNIYVSTPRSSSPSSHASNSFQKQNAAPMSNSTGISDRNQLNLARIEDGQDTRTTVMIKNIPNKMSDADLVTYIGKVCPRRIDFLYLRMDFQNGCNVGYAFVNFIHVQDLLRFAQQRLGEKWNMFSSEKVLQMSYANYQGKEALVEKFKNSCIMDEREAWRPKIFYSSGPDQGRPEPFPAPTHFRRKERSSHNRGALFVPGVNAGLSTSHGLLNNSGRRYQEDYRPQQGRMGLVERHQLRNGRHMEGGSSGNGFRERRA